MTREQVERLKRDWKQDPIFDLEDCEGFDLYKEELTIFRLECELKWAREELKRYKDAVNALFALMPGARDERD